MKNNIFLAGLTLTVFMLFACGESKKETEAKLTEKREALNKLKQEQNKIGDEINKLLGEIAELDPNATSESSKLVAIDTVQTGSFRHFIELQGTIDADNISIVTPRGNPGQVKEIFVKKGDIVKKGQLLLKLDDAIFRQNLIASTESIKTLKAQLSLATELLGRQQNLWNQGIGTEVQLLTAKNNVETLQTQIRSAEEQVKVIQEQQKTTNVYAEVNGIADEVNVRVGEFFQGAIGLQPQIRIVNTSTLKVVTNVPENYASRIVRGTKVLVRIPDVNKQYESVISFISASIDPTNRSFITEAKLPSDGALKPNMIANVGMLDYESPNAITILVNVVQSDQNGKYVYVLESNNDRFIARRRSVTIGQLQSDRVEIKSGLASGDMLVTAGYQDLYDGQMVSLNPAS